MLLLLPLWLCLCRQNTCNQIACNAQCTYLRCGSSSGSGRQWVLSAQDSRGGGAKRGNCHCNLHFASRISHFAPGVVKWPSSSANGKWQMGNGFLMATMWVKSSSGTALIDLKEFGSPPTRKGEWEQGTGNREPHYNLLDWMHSSENILDFYIMYNCKILNK